MNPTKKCSTCGVDKPLGAFYRSTKASDRLSYRCKSCSLLYKRQHYISKRATKDARVDAAGQPIKRCNTCALDKPLSAFAKRSRAHRGLSQRCKACDRIERRQRYLADPEAAREKSRLWSALHPDKKRATWARWYERNGERYALVRALGSALKYERSKEQIRKYQREHPWVQRLANARRRARKLAATGSHSAADIERLYAQQSGLCAYCARAVASAYHVDHMVPLARGGSDDPSNLCIACRLCNQRKHTRTAEEFRALLRALSR